MAKRRTLKTKKIKTLESPLDKLLSFPLSSFRGISLNVPLAGSTATIPDDVRECDDTWEDVAFNPSDAKSDVKIKVNNVGDCDITLVLHALKTTADSVIDTMPIKKNRSFTFNLTPGNIASIKCCRCEGKSCKYNVA
ncbi:MAG: hypothetical protein KGH95_07935 [Thaumarchaeota archaeon]|nr:hypothetical protein [Nitrososphaerota archaeon]